MKTLRKEFGETEECKTLIDFAEEELALEAPEAHRQEPAVDDNRSSVDSPKPVSDKE